MGSWLKKPSVKILVILLLSCLVLIGVVVMSMPIAIERTLVFGGDYVLGQGSTSVSKVKIPGLEKLRVENLNLKSPSSFGEGELVSIDTAIIYLDLSSIFSEAPQQVELLLDGVQLTIDASLGSNGLKLNLLEAYRKIKDQLPKKNDKENEQSSEGGPLVELSKLSITDSRLVGQIRLPGGKTESISLTIPAMIFTPEANLQSEQTTNVGELYREVLDLLIGRALNALEVASEKWQMSKGEREAFLLMLRSWSEEGVSDIVKDRVKGQVKKVLEDRLPSGLKDLLGGDKSSED